MNMSELQLHRKVGRVFHHDISKVALVRLLFLSVCLYGPRIIGTPERLGSVATIELVIDRHDRCIRSCDHDESTNGDKDDVETEQELPLECSRLAPRVVDMHGTPVKRHSRREESHQLRRSTTWRERQRRYIHGLHGCDSSQKGANKAEKVAEEWNALSEECRQCDCIQIKELTATYFGNQERDSAVSNDATQPYDPMGGAVVDESLLAFQDTHEYILGGEVGLKYALLSQ